MVDVGGELFCALDFTFLQGEVSLPRRGRKPEGLKGAPQRSRRVEWLLVHDVERTFRLDSNQRGEDFPSARGTKNLCIRLQIPVALDSNQTEPGAGAPAPAYGGVVTGSSQRNR